jgi:hypothetical protein
MVHLSHAHIHVINGEELGETPQAALHRPGQRGSMLFIFLDLPNASPSTCADIIRTLSDGFARAPGGLTSALRLAIKLASERARQLSQGLPLGQRLEGSLSCALLTGDSLIIAQAGPAIAYARAASGAFEVIAEPGAPAIGSQPVVDVRFSHFALQPGDVFVLTGARSMLDVDIGLIKACMGKGDARMVAGYLNANVKHGRMVGLAISVDGVLASSVTEKLQATQAVSAGAPATAQAKAAQAAFPPQPAPAPPPTRPLLQPAWQALGRVAAGMRRALFAFGERLLPKDTPAVPTSQTEWSTFLLAAIAVLLPIVVGVVVTVLYLQLSGEAERLRLRNLAEAQVAAAQAVADPAQAREAWARALETMNEYSARHPDDRAYFDAARAEARARLDAISGVTRVQPTLLAELGGNAPRRLAAAASGVYVLNLANSTVSYYVLNAERTATVGREVTIRIDDAQSASAPISDVVRATTVDSRWRTEGAILFSTGRIYEYSSATGRAEPLALPVSADAAPAQVKAGALYNNTVYLLDAAVGQIWRYRLDGNRMRAIPAYFRSPYNPLKESLDFAIDGAIYVLLKNGAVLKYFDRRPQPFMISGLPDGSLVQPAAIALSGEDMTQGQVFILDASGAVVVLSKSGQFIRQYRGQNDEFVGAEDFSLDRVGNILYIYIVTRERLYAFTLLA